MASFATVPPKQLFAIINGVSQAKYFNDNTITAEFIKEHIFPTDENFPLSTIITMMTDLEKILTTLVSKGITQQSAQLNDILSETYGLTDAAIITTFGKFMKEKGGLIREKIVAQTRFAKNLRNISWRLDVLKNEDGTQTCVALVKFEAMNPDGTPSETIVEMEKDELNKMLANLQQIDAKLNAFAQ